MNTLINKVLKATYGYMGLGLIISAIVAYFTGLIVGDTSSVEQAKVLGKGYLWTWVICAVGELIMVWKLAKHAFDYKLWTLRLFFVIFSILNGITLAPIFIVASSVDIFVTFLITCAVFITMAIIGFVTKIDLSKFSTFFLMGLIGTIIASIVCIFWANSILYWAVTIFGTLLFVGITAWDMQDLKKAMEGHTEFDDYAHRTALAFALDLYLDFINLFVLIIRYVTDTK